MTKLIKDQGPVDIFIHIILVVLCIAAWVWTVQTVWLWLAVPIFGLPALTYAQAFAVLFLSSIFNGRLTRKNLGEKAKTVEEAKADVGFAIAKIVVVLGVGWVIAQFI